MHLKEGNRNTAHIAVQSSHKPLFCLHSDPATSISHCMTHALPGAFLLLHSCCLKKRKLPKCIPPPLISSASMVHTGTTFSSLMRIKAFKASASSCYKVSADTTWKPSVQESCSRALKGKQPYISVFRQAYKVNSGTIFASQFQPSCSLSQVFSIVLLNRPKAPHSVT